MNKKTVKQSWYPAFLTQYQSFKKQQKKKFFRLKAKLFLTVFLPFFILVLGVKVVDTFVRIHMRKLFIGPLPK